jgi:hypothetical protein
MPLSQFPGRSCQKYLVYSSYMELLIAGGIAALGYGLSVRNDALQSSSSATAQRSSAFSGGPGSYPIVDARNLGTYEALAEKKFRDSQTPKATGVVSPVTNPADTTPFFTSAKKQNTNNGVKQSLLELYTGTLGVETSKTGTYRNKTEAEALFKPRKQDVTSSGSSGNPMTYDTSRSAAYVSGLQNNISPVEQRRVGPGVGVGTHVPAADGFHPMHRVLPPNVGEHKKNTLPGGVNPGGVTVSARVVDPRVHVKSVPRVWTYERRPPEKSGAAVAARSSRPFGNARERPPGFSKCNDGRVGEEGYFGGAGMASHPQTAGEWDRDKRDDDLSPLPSTNVALSRHGTGAYVAHTYDDARLQSQQRESATHGPGALKGDQYRHAVPRDFITTATMRDMTHGPWQGGIGHFVPTTSNRPADAPQPTLREQIHDQNIQGAIAPAVVTGPTVTCTNLQLLREAKRGIHRSEGYVTGPQRTEAFRRANRGDDPLGDRIPGRVAVRDDGDMRAQARVGSHAASSTVYVNVMKPGASSNGHNKLPEPNMRQDFSIAKNVLKDNPFHVSFA